MYFMKLLILHGWANSFVNDNILRLTSCRCVFFVALIYLLFLFHSRMNLHSFLLIILIWYGLFIFFSFCPIGVSQITSLCQSYLLLIIFCTVKTLDLCCIFISCNHLDRQMTTLSFYLNIISKCNNIYGDSPSITFKVFTFLLVFIIKQ